MNAFAKYGNSLQLTLQYTLQHNATQEDPNSIMLNQVF